MTVTAAASIWQHVSNNWLVCWHLRLRESKNEVAGKIGIILSPIHPARGAGTDETEKLDAVFATAPLWLLWITHGDVAGHVLGLKVPDLPSKSRFARPKAAHHLPEGSFEWRRLPD
jgi:hypothetical protein